MWRMFFTSKGSLQSDLVGNSLLLPGWFSQTPLCIRYESLRASAFLDTKASYLFPSYWSVLRGNIQLRKIIIKKKKTRKWTSVKRCLFPSLPFYVKWYLQPKTAQKTGFSQGKKILRASSLMLYPFALHYCFLTGLCSWSCTWCNVFLFVYLCLPSLNGSFGLFPAVSSVSRIVSDFKDTVNKPNC